MISSLYNRYYNLSGLRSDTDKANFTSEDFLAVGKLVQLLKAEQDSEAYEQGYDYVAVLETVIPDSDHKPCYASIPCYAEELTPLSVH